MQLISLRSFIIAVAVLLSAFSNLAAQNRMTINIESIDEGTTYSLLNDTLSISFNAFLISSGDLDISITSDEGKLLKTSRISVVSGLNEVDLPLSLEHGHNYFCLLKDNNRKVAQFTFQKATKLKSQFTASLDVSTIALACGSAFGNEFLIAARFSFGSALYQYQWLLYDDQMNPISTEITGSANEGEVPIIRVKNQPAFWVVFKARDACGNRVLRAVRISCAPDEKKESSVMIEFKNDIFQDPKINN